MTTPAAIAPATAPRSSLGWRLLTAAIGIPAILGVVYVGSGLFAMAVVLAVQIGFREFSDAFKLPRTPIRDVAAITAASLTGFVWLWGEQSIPPLLVAGVIGSLVTLIAMGDVPADLSRWALAVAGILYVGLLGQYFVALRELPDGRSWVLLAIFTTFATDTGAYASGRLLGRHKLAPRLSPSKTVEGAIGGLLSGALAAWGLSYLFGLNHPAAVMLALGAAAAVAGQLGDLTESLIKRSAGVKDMGAILPGHGGLLDRLDSLLFVVPLVYYAAHWWLVE